MGRVLRLAAPGLVGVGVAVAAWSAWWLANDLSRNKLQRPRPIEHRRVIPLYDGRPVWSNR